MIGQIMGLHVHLADEVPDILRFGPGCAVVTPAEAVALFSCNHEALVRFSRGYLAYQKRTQPQS